MGGGALAGAGVWLAPGGDAGEAGGVEFELCAGHGLLGNKKDGAGSPTEIGLPAPSSQSVV